MKKVLIQTGSFYPAQEGGPTITLYWLASGLARAGYDVKVLASTTGLNGQYPEDSWVTINDFSVIYATPSYGKQIAKPLIQECDCLIRSGVCQLPTHISNLKWLRRGKHIVLSPRGELFDPAIYHKGKLYGALKMMAFKLFGVLYGKRIVYHATSSEEVEQIRKIMGKDSKVVLIPNYMILPKRVVVDEEDRKYFVYVGRVAPIKALDNLIQSLGISESFRESDYSFVIVGNNTGAYYETLCDLIKSSNLESKIRFVGVKTGEEKDSIVAGARYLFLVSHSENFGNVVIEALAQGTPVVASEGTPWKELITNNAGWWVNNSPDSLARVIDAIITQPEEQYILQRRGAWDTQKNLIYTIRLVNG